MLVSPLTRRKSTYSKQLRITFPRLRIFCARDYLHDYFLELSERIERNQETRVALCQKGDFDAAKRVPLYTMSSFLDDPKIWNPSVFQPLMDVQRDGMLSEERYAILYGAALGYCESVHEKVKQQKAEKETAKEKGKRI
jgi:hypothetical protein